MQRHRAVEPARELAYEYLSEGDPVVHAPQLDARVDRSSEALGLEGARHLDTPFGPAVVVDHVFEPDRSHGRVRLGDHAVHDDAALAMLGRWGASPAESEARRRIVFFDLETTGLSGGAGTVAFLVGCGYFENGAFVTRQYFLPGFASERALLHAVGDLLASAKRLVTYNGKSFDVPVMEVRWAFQRMCVPIEDVAHLDMLPVARRFWRADDDGLLQSCRLASLERSLLGFEREGDVPGWEIPARYFDYIRHGRVATLEPVLSHNRLDLVSLAVLTARAQHLAREGPSASLEPREWLALGWLYDAHGDWIRAEPCYERVVSSRFSGHALRLEAWRRVARLRRRRRRFDEAAMAWQQVLTLEPRGPAAQEAREALAVHHEHRERNLTEARRLAIEAMRSEMGTARRAAVSHRLARLERKLQHDVDQGSIFGEGWDREGQRGSGRGEDREPS